MKMRTVRVVVYMAWWWPFYKHGLLLAAHATGMEPDIAKIVYVAQLAVRTRLVPVNGTVQA